MVRIYGLWITVVLVGGCQRQEPAATGARANGPASAQQMEKLTLREARQGFQTKLLRRDAGHGQIPKPPPELFRLVRYDAPLGKLAAYVSVPPAQGKKYPAIIWLVGGFSNSLGTTPWDEASPENDQSARAFRQAGILMMYPSLRGGNGNPGVKEGFYGEVEDVLAACRWLAKQDYVDSQRIYLGGHSTGGTLALLIAALPNGFRAIFSFGPVHEVSGYGAQNLPFDVQDERERMLRAPALWLHGITQPTFVLEGTENTSNWPLIDFMAQRNQNSLVRFLPVPGTDHFSVLAPVTRLLAQKIQQDKGVITNITLSAAELTNLGDR